MQIQLIRRRRGTSTPTPPAFSPADVAGLVHWVDASTLALANGAAVTSWPDLSPSGLTATTAGGYPPTYRTGIRNGLAGVEFIIGGDALTTTTPACTAVDNFTQILFMKLNASPAEGTVTVLHGNGGNGWGISPQVNVGGLGWLRGGAAWEGGYGPTTTTARVLVARRQAGTFTLRVDGGAAVGSTTAAPITPAGETRIGSHSGGAAAMLLFECLTYAAAVSNADLDRIGAYLAAKWALTWSPVS